MKNCFRFVIISLTFALFQQPALINAEPERSFNNELDRIIENVGENLVTVKGLGAFRNFIATGTGIDTLGHILTSSSVCDVADFEIVYSDGKSYKGRKIGIDKQSGLCILEIDGPKIRPVSWKIPNSLKPESWVAAPGLRYGQISGINFGTYLGQTDEGLLTLSIEVNPGSFGGIVLDSDGVAIGILVARESNFAFPGEPNRHCRDRQISRPGLIKTKAGPMP